MTESTMPELWYESNAYFGTIKNLDQLKDKALKLQLGTAGNIKNLDEFLDHSLSPKDHPRAPSFGTRIDNVFAPNLREFLDKHGVLDEFLTMCKI